MKNTLITLAVLIIVAVGLWYFFVRNDDRAKNADVLEGSGTYEIATSSVNYYKEVKGYLAEPAESGEFPGVVMIHENRGLRPEIIMTADKLAAEGYRVLAVDLFNGQVVEAQEQARQLTANFDQAEGVANMRAAAAYLRSKGSKKIASLGWCFGGRQSIELAISGESLDATVVYYGGNMATTTQQLAPIRWPVLGIFGDQDQVIPVATVHAFEDSLNDLGVENDIHIYRGVGHAFANPSGMNYAPEETADAWKETLSFLQENLK